jgi:putative phosphoesterase
LRIGVVSDTHMFYRAKQLPHPLVEGLQGVDRILHAGDWQEAKVVALFEQIAPVDGVAGNNDGFDLVDRFGRSKILELAGCRIGMVHGDGGSKTTLERAIEAFDGKQLDVILFGHSHIPYNQMHHGVLLLNPGSPTDKRRQPRYSFGILELGKEIRAEIHFFDKT